MIDTEASMVLIGSLNEEVPDVGHDPGMPSNLAWIVYDQTLFVIRDGYDDGTHGPLPIVTSI